MAHMNIHKVLDPKLSHLVNVLKPVPGWAESDSSPKMIGRQDMVAWIDTAALCHLTTVPPSRLITGLINTD